MNAIDQAFLRAYQAPGADPPASACDSQERTSQEEPPAAAAGVTETTAISGGETLYFQVWTESPALPSAAGPSAAGPSSIEPSSQQPAATLREAPMPPQPAGSVPVSPPTGTSDQPATRSIEPPMAGPTASAFPSDPNRAGQPTATSGSARQPLSTFAPPIEPIFRPGLEVDAFRWPAECEDLTTHWAASLEPAVSALIATAESGRSIIGVAGAAEGSGATTLTLCLARLAARAGKSVALVDGDFTDPQLASRLGLAVDSGWEHVLSGAAPLADNVIHSRGDEVALLPLVAGGLRASEMIDSVHAPATARTLRQNYDLVLIDFGSIAGGGQTAIARKIAKQFRLEAALLATHRADGGLLPRVAQLAPELAEVMIGTVENQITIAAAG